jgi:hypothetical protein
MGAEGARPYSRISQAKGQSRHKRFFTSVFNLFFGVAGAAAAFFVAKN